MTPDTTRDDGAPADAPSTGDRADPAAQRRALRRAPRRRRAPTRAATTARDDLVHLHLPLVEHCARRFRNRGEPLRGPRPGRHDRADQVDRPVRHRPRRRVLDVRDPDDHRRDQALLPRQGLGDPGAAPAPGAADADRRRRPPSSPSRSAAPPRRASWPSAIGCTVEEIIEGHRVQQRLLHALPRRHRRLRRRRRRSMLDALGIDDEALEHVEIRESIKPLLDRLDAAREADPAAAVLQEHDPVADRRGDRRLPDARLPAAHPHPRRSCATSLRGRRLSAARSLRLVGERRRRSPGGSMPASTTSGDHRQRDRDARSCRRPGSSRPRRAGSAGRARPGRAPRTRRRVSCQAQSSSPTPYTAKKTRGGERPSSAGPRSGWPARAPPSSDQQQRPRRPPARRPRRAAAGCRCGRSGGHAGSLRRGRVQLVTESTSVRGLFHDQTLATSWGCARESVHIALARAREHRATRTCTPA